MNVTSASDSVAPPVRRRGRPKLGGPFFFLVADLAQMLVLEPGQALALLECERSRQAFFPSARRSTDAGGWRVPAGNVRRLVGPELKPMLRVAEVMRLLRCSREKVLRAVDRYARGEKVDVLPGVKVLGDWRFSFFVIRQVMERGTAAA